MSAQRDAQILQAAYTLILATGEFDAVYVSKLPEETPFPSGGRSCCYLNPSEISAHALHQFTTIEESKHFDHEGPTFKRTFRYTALIAVRIQDQVLRDDEADRLADVVQNTLSGVSLGGLTVPAWTKCPRLRYMPPKMPERRVSVECESAYFRVGYGTRDIQT